MEREGVRGPGENKKEEGIALALPWTATTVHIGARVGDIDARNEVSWLTILDRSFEGRLSLYPLLS